MQHLSLLAAFWIGLGLGPVLTMCLKIIDVISYVGDKCLNNVLQIDIDNL